MTNQNNPNSTISQAEINFDQKIKTIFSTNIQNPNQTQAIEAIKRQLLIESTLSLQWLFSWGLVRKLQILVLGTVIAASFLIGFQFDSLLFEQDSSSSLALVSTDSMDTIDPAQQLFIPVYAIDTKDHLDFSSQNVSYDF